MHFTGECRGEGDRLPVATMHAVPCTTRGRVPAATNRVQDRDRIGERVVLCEIHRFSVGEVAQRGPHVGTGHSPGISRGKPEPKAKNPPTAIRTTSAVMFKIRRLLMGAEPKQ